MSNRIHELKELVTKLINYSSKVFIVGHNSPDYDCIGASLGLSTLVKGLEKEAYIIVDDIPLEIDSGVKKVIDDSKDSHKIINLEEFKKLADKDSLLITVDVSKDYRISVKNDLDKVGNILIIDHHQEDNHTINTPYKYITDKVSSTCEVVAQLLNAKQIKYNRNIANYLLAGIILDTQRFKKNSFPATFDIVEKLCRKGADYEAVNKLFISDFLEDKTIYSLIVGEHAAIDESLEPKEIIIKNTHIEAYPTLFGSPTVSYTVNRSGPKTIYKQVELAKTADKMLKYADVSFALGYVSQTDVGMSARSTCDVDVGKILQELQLEEFPYDEQDSDKYEKSGGGNKESAGGRFTTTDIFSVERKLMELVQTLATPSLPEETTEEIEKPIELVKKVIKK